ncbi:hypothetical protein KTO58_06945 [Chitinophaga pendula]|uniref:hypothetical protein n=1 Tax=Chitinophaga TaxID=79328 RepID=UPI0012FE27AE|nr:MULTISPECIES: hypothetical protein [Chitinophaga]UCJ08915.1 hypothetical protein KTO58_06945 [Chitinophaga pendula]
MKKQSLNNNAKKLSLKKVIIAPLSQDNTAMRGNASRGCVSIGLTCIDCTPSLSGCPSVFVCES